MKNVRVSRVALYKAFLAYAGIKSPNQKAT